jgi:flagellar hook-basal body complex protein FliE
MTVISNVGLTRDILANAASKLKQNPSGQSDFSDHLKQALQQVSQAQNEATKLANDFEAGNEVDVVKVMMAREKSSLAFEATLQVRNKLLSAYKDIVSMPV